MAQLLITRGADVNYAASVSKDKTSYAEKQEQHVLCLVYKSDD